jgi:hypothetical protein
MLIKKAPLLVAIVVLIISLMNTNVQAFAGFDSELPAARNQPMGTTIGFSSLASDSGQTEVVGINPLLYFGSISAVVIIALVFDILLIRKEIAKLRQKRTSLTA